MTDKRNIVIKVSYPVAGKATKNITPKTVTEWNVKRIVLAAGLVALLIAALFFIFGNDTPMSDSGNPAVPVNTLEQSADTKNIEGKKSALSGIAAAETNSLVNSKKEPKKKSQQTADISGKGVIKKQLNENVTKEQNHSKLNPNVSRAVLTYDVKNKEPASEIVRGVSLKKPVWVYYFTELKAMKGDRVYHEWLKNGVIVSKEVLTVSANTWRTSSRKLLSDSEKGKWTVRLVDKNGRLLNEKNFKVE